MTTAIHSTNRQLKLARKLAHEAKAREDLQHFYSEVEKGKRRPKIREKRMKAFGAPIGRPHGPQGFLF